MHALLVASASDAPVPLPDGYGAFLVQSALVLIAVCALAWLVLRFGLRRLYAPSANGSPIRVIARAALEPRRNLYIIEVGGKTLLVGSTESGPLSTLAELDPAAISTSPAPPSAKRSFIEIFRRDH